VKDVETGGLLILSNNHILANNNEANLGDAILQPGPADGGKDVDEIAVLERFIPMSLDSGPGCWLVLTFVKIINKFLSFFNRKSRLEVAKPMSGPNVVDCAVAKPHNEGDLALEILEIGRPQKTIMKPSIGLEVQKFGRTTRYTRGKIIGLDASVNVNYGNGKVAVFEHQIVSDIPSAGGDSGNLIVDMERYPVGLLFAGSDQVAILNEIERVVTALNVEFI